MRLYTPSIRRFTVSLGIGLLLLGSTATPAAARGQVPTVLGERPIPTAANPRPYTLRPRGPFPTLPYYQTPALTDLRGIWLGELRQASNIRTGPGLSYRVDRVWSTARRVIVYGTATATNGEIWYQVSHYPEPTLYVHQDQVRFLALLQVPATTRLGRWVDVNLTQQTLIAYDGNQPVAVSQIASGKPGFETKVGTWAIYWRTAVQDMDGGDGSRRDPFYNIERVPWNQFFTGDGQALHGAYWHDEFGRPRSHGCVNLPIRTAAWLFQWASRGTPVVVHYAAVDQPTVAAATSLTETPGGRTPSHP